jgi:large subunit ribosomal protein L2
MALKTFKPITPGLRQLVLVDRSELFKGKPIKRLTEGKHASGGRNNHGRVTVRFRGGGHKQTYRIVDFKRRGHAGQAAVVDRIEYDPNRTAFIALIRYPDGELSYIIAPQRLAVGDSVTAGDNVDIKPGNAMPVGAMPVGTIVHNVETKIGKGGTLARSAGNYAQIVARDLGYVTVRLKSGEQRLVHGLCYATVGAVSNPDHMNISIGKAGRNRWLGLKPHNRGVTMNPIDHPHGGGEGRTSGGRHPVTPWGLPTKGKKTRSNKRTDTFIVNSRHARKKKG